MLSRLFGRSLGKKGPALKSVLFDPPEEANEGTHVLILSMAGESMRAMVGDSVTIQFFKQEVAAKSGLEVWDFQLSAGGEILYDDMLVCKLTACDISGRCSDATLSKTVSVYMLRHTTLERYEQESLQEWREVATDLTNPDVDDEVMLIRLRTFLDNHPELVNFQYSCADKAERPLLSFAIESAADTKSRQQCVDELIKRGSRIHIRHANGFLNERARDSGSAFAEHLENKAQELTAYEKESIKAWREVSSKLCGECYEPVEDEVEMTRIVNEFCMNYPEMVNFQNNHAANQSTDEPHGYFGYAPLIAFAGAQKCRQRRGQSKESAHTRRGAVEALLSHGARVDMWHGGKSAIKWMQLEGSQLVGWLQEQFKAPMPLRAPFDFARSP